jgi:glutathione S-transferase
MLELYHWEPNTYFLKPLIALHEKKAGFASRWFDATSFEQFANGFPRNTESTLHLEREGPVLVSEGAVVSSSYFLIEYINEVVPGVDLCPGGSFQRYQQRAWGQVLGALGSGVSALGCAKYLAPALKSRDPSELRAKLDRVEPLERRQAWLTVIDGGYSDERLAGIRERLKVPLKRIEDTLKRTYWLAGNDYSLADIDAFSFLNSLGALAPDVFNAKECPRTMEFVERMRARDAVKAALAMSRSGKPQEAFVPGQEASRWG